MDAVTGMELGVLYNNITGSFIFSLIFCLLFFRSKEKFLKSLAFFWGFSALSFLAATAIYAGFFQPAAGILYLAGVTAAGVYLLKGSYSFLGENVNKTWFLVGVIGLAAALGGCYHFGNPRVVVNFSDDISRSGIFKVWYCFYKKFFNNHTKSYRFSRSFICSRNDSISLCFSAGVVYPWRYNCAGWFRHPVRTGVGWIIL